MVPKVWAVIQKRVANGQKLGPAKAIQPWVVISNVPFSSFQVLSISFIIDWNYCIVHVLSWNSNSCVLLKDNISAVARQPRTSRSRGATIRRGPRNIYCISKLEPSLYAWLLLFRFLPSMQSRWIKHVISWFVNFEKELRTFGHYSSFCKVMVTSEQGRLLIKSWPSSLNLAGIALVRWDSRGNLRHNECAVQCCAIALQMRTDRETRFLVQR